MPLRAAMIAYTHYESDPRVRREAEMLASRGDTVTVFCLRGNGSLARESIRGVDVQRIDLPRYRGADAASYLGSYLRFFGSVATRLAVSHSGDPFDLVQVHTMPDFMVFAALIPRLGGARVVLDMHDLMPDLYALKFDLDRQGTRVAALRAIQRVSTTFADAVICVHEPQYRLLLRDGVPAHKLAIVMNSADPALFPPREAEPPIRPGEAIQLVYHGTILHRFGVDLALEAFARARVEEPRLAMSILGDGDFLPEVRARASQLGLSQDVLHFSEGRLRLDAVAARIRGAHIGIIPNRDDQEDSVLPTKLLEYVSVGIPAIATRTRCITRYFDDSQIELVPVGDAAAMTQAILRLCRDGKRRKALVNASRAWQETYGYEVQKRLFLRTIDALCPRR